MKKPSPNSENCDVPGQATGLDVVPATLLDALSAHIALLDSDGVVRTVNEAWKRFGEENLLSAANHGIGQNYLEICRQAASRGTPEAAAVLEGLERVLRGESPEFQWEYPCHTGAKKRWFHLTITPLQDGDHRGAVVAHTDISERRQAEEQARRLRDFHSASSRIHGLIARGGDLQTLYENACRIAVEQGGLRLAWVGLATNDGHIRPTALWGHNEGYVDLLQICGDPEHPGGKGPAGQAFRSGAPACCNDLETDDGSVQTRAEALQRGYRSCAAFPLTATGRVAGVLAVYSGETNCFGDEELELLGLLAESLSHAMHDHALDQERLHSEQALLASEGRLRAIVENEPECVKVITPDGRLQDINPAGLNMIEASSLDAVRDSPVESLVHPEDRASFNELHERNLAGYTGQLRFRIVGLRGTERWMETHSTPLFDPQGFVQSVLSVTRDVTERRRAEEALRQSEANFRSLFTEAPTGIAVTNLEGRIIQANPAYCGMLGYTEEELCQINFVDLTHPDDRARNLDLYHELISGNRPSFLMEKRYLRKDGSPVWVRISVSTRKDASGHANQLIAVTEDITELRVAAEELTRHQALLRIAGIVGKLGGWSVSLPEMTLVWSDQMAAIHDVEPGATPDLETAFGYYALEDRERVRSAFLECVRTGRPFEVTARLVTAKGRQLWIRAIGEAVRDAGGSIVRVQGAFQDISDQKTAALEIQRLGQRLTTTLESMTDAFYILDKKWHFVFLNPQAERLLQRRREELLNREVWVEFPEAVGRSFEHEYRRAMTTGHSVTFEEFYPSLNTWFEVHAYPSEEGLAVYFRDVTERRRSEEALRQSEERFREMAENIDEVFFNYDPVNNRLLYVSPAFERLWGRPLHDILADPTSYLNFIHSEDRHRAEGAFQRQLAGHTTQEEFRILHPDGNVHWVQELAVAVKDAGGKLERIVGTMRDITAGKLAEARLREQAALLDKAQDAILVRDMEHRILYWNKSAERLYGWSSEEAIGRTSNALLYRDPSAFATAHAETIQRGEWSGELEQITKDGKRLTVEVHWSLVRDDKGQPKSVLAINTDVTERKRIEQQFLRAQRMESIGTLAGGIAHDLNNVLAPILMSIELLKLDEARADKLDILATIESSAQRGADMVRQVLSFARGVEGRQIRLQPAHLVREVAKIANETFLKSIRVVSRIAEDLWTIQGDPTQLHQVLLNLCVNARDAMPEGGTLTLSADNLELDDPYAASLGLDIQPGRHVRLRVEDTGSGMPPEVQERIFDPFFTTKEPGKGTGLGLSTAQAIVRSHGGLLRAQSEPGEGTRFDLYLPALEGVEAESPAPARQLPRGSGQTVLVIDDEDSVRQIARQTLQTFGYRVLLAADGAEATAVFAARHKEIDVVLTDMMMPVMDGAAAIQVLLRISPGARILASSGLHVEAMKARAERAGVRRFIPKPYTTETLLQALHEVLTDPVTPRG